mgnify:CR=1 FL=1
MEATSVILLLGSNDAQAADIVQRAINIIANSVGDVVKLSAEYRSKAYGFTSDREFINRAVEVTTTADAYEVFRAYAYDRTEKGIETWPGEEPYEVGLIRAWLAES